MDLAAASRTRVTPVEVQCLKCKRTFAGKKRFKALKGRFLVKSTGLGLHLRSNSCDGPCLRHHTEHNVSTVDFSASLLLAAGQVTPVPPPSSSSSSSMPSHENCSALVAKEQNEVFFCEDETSSKDLLHSSKSSSSAPAVTNHVEKFDNNKSTTRPNALSSSRLSVASYSLNHKQLDFLLCHQMLEPCIPGPAALKPSNFLAQASLLLPQVANAPSLADGVNLDLLSIGEEDDEEEEESSTGSASCSFQSMFDGALGDVDEVGLEHSNAGSNWIVAKRQEFLLRESRQSPATPQLQSEVRLLKLLLQHKASLQLHPLIHNWARESLQLNHDFSRSIRPRHLVLSELEERFDMQSSRFTTTIVSCLPDERPTVVHVASFADAVCSLLSDPELMKGENLSFPDAHHPFLQIPPAHPNRRAPRKPDLSELHHGSWHKATSLARCSGPKDVLAGVIGHMDGMPSVASVFVHGTSPLPFLMQLPAPEKRLE
jgi:hypothetical protein